METVFFACFLFGALFTVTSFLLGFAEAGLHIGDGGLQIDTGGHGGLHHGNGHHSPLPLLNLSSLLAFLTWFGVVGYILMRFSGWAALPALVPAVLAGLAAAYVISLVLRKLLSGSRELDPKDYQLEGTIARVTSSIFEGGVGEIVFTQAGARRSEAARSRSGAAIARDTEVVVIDYSNGIAIVEPWNEFIGREQPGELGPGRQQPG